MMMMMMMMHYCAICYSHFKQYIVNNSSLIGTKVVSVCRMWWI